MYVKLSQLQAMSDRKGRVNTVYVRADSADAVSGVAKRIESGFPGAKTTTSQDLADRVTGSLADAKDLAGKLGGALTVVGLVAAFLIAGLLTLSSVTKRTRELGTLKAIGWPQRLVVRQVTGEALAQGALGGVARRADRRGRRRARERHRPRAEGHGGPGGLRRPGASPGPAGPGGPAARRVRPGRCAGRVRARAAQRVRGRWADARRDRPRARSAACSPARSGSLRAARLRPADALRHID